MYFVCCFVYDLITIAVSDGCQHLLESRAWYMGSFQHCCLIYISSCTLNLLPIFCDFTPGSLLQKPVASHYAPLHDSRGPVDIMADEAATFPAVTFGKRPHVIHIDLCSGGANASVFGKLRRCAVEQKQVMKSWCMGVCQGKVKNT